MRNQDERATRPTAGSSAVEDGRTATAMRPFDREWCFDRGLLRARAHRFANLGLDVPVVERQPVELRCLRRERRSTLRVTRLLRCNRRQVDDPRILLV